MAIAPTTKREADEMALKLFCRVHSCRLNHGRDTLRLIARGNRKLRGTLSALRGSRLGVRVTVVSAVHRSELERPPRTR